MTISPTPTFKIGSIPIYGDLILSPMDGYSDLPFRAMARRLGSAMSYTEFVNAIDVKYGHPDLHLRLSYKEDERPVVYQIFDDQVDRLVEAAIRLQEHRPDIIDVNMGCSARNVAGRGAGAGLLCNPAKIAEIFSRLTKVLQVPVTGKIRLGWDDGSRNYLEVAKIIADNGGQLVAVHGRTKAQGYTGQADWHAIAAVKQALSIPVLANGDVRTVADIQHIKELTGCDGVLIGRAAIGNPWIFSRLDRDQVSPEQVRQTMLEHLEEMLAFYGPERGLILFRKHTSRYISPHGLSDTQRQQLLTATQSADFMALLDDILLGSSGQAAR